MIDQNLIQFYRVQLSQAACAYEAERDMRLRIERSTVQHRVVLFELAQRWVPCQLDDLWKTTDVNAMTTDQFVRWLKSQVDAQLFEYRAMCNGRHTERLATLKAALAEREAIIQERDRQINDLHEQLKQGVAFKEQNGQLRAQVDHAEQQKDDLVADLEASRAIVQRLRSQSILPPLEPAPLAMSLSSSDKPDWYRDWLASLTPENIERYKIALQLIGQGEAFFRSEILEHLNALGLTTEPNPDKPTGTGARLLADLINSDFIAEIKAGYSAAVPVPLYLTERGVEVYRRLSGETVEESPFQRLLKRHKTIEHTTLNLLARNVLQRFGFTDIDLFPDLLRTAAGAPVDPDLVATNPEGERLLIECERMTMHRTAEERNAKWTHLAELSHGQLYVVVFGGRQQSDLMAEISEWIQATQTKKISLSICQYLKAIKPESPSVWTYTTTWTIV